MSIKYIYKNLKIEPDYQEEVEKANRRLYETVRYLNIELNRKGQMEAKRRVFELAGELSNHYLEFFIKYEEGDRALKENIIFTSYILRALEEKCSYPNITYTFISKVEEILEKLPLLDLGYKFQGGQIIKSDASELDESLIIENLKWLEDYSNTRELFSKSLENYLRKSYSDSITNAHSALEGLVKTILGTDGRLDNEKTRKELLKKLNLTSNWGQILFHFSKIAHEFSSRHGKKDTNNASSKSRREKVEEELAEFYIYITGTFIRLISRRIK